MKSRILLLVLLTGLASGCHHWRYGGWTPSPYQQQPCLDHGCFWNADKAQCECGFAPKEPANP